MPPPPIVLFYFTSWLFFQTIYLQVFPWHFPLNFMHHSPLFLVAISHILPSYFILILPLISSYISLPSKCLCFPLGHLATLPCSSSSAVFTLHPPPIHSAILFLNLPPHSFSSSSFFPLLVLCYIKSVRSVLKPFNLMVGEAGDSPAFSVC